MTTSGVLGADPPSAPGALAPLRRGLERWLLDPRDEVVRVPSPDGRGATEVPVLLALHDLAWDPEPVGESVARRLALPHPTTFAHVVRLVVRTWETVCGAVDGVGPAVPLVAELRPELLAAWYRTIDAQITGGRATGRSGRGAGRSR